MSGAVIPATAARPARGRRVGRAHAASPAARRGGAALGALLVAALLGAEPSAWARTMPRLEGAAIAAVPLARPARRSSADQPAGALEGVKITLTGDGFLPGDAGPIVWLNGTPTWMVRVSPDRRTLDALLEVPLERLESAGSGRFVVEYQDSPTAPRVAVPGAPAVTRLDPAQREQLDARKRALGAE